MASEGSQCPGFPLNRRVGVYASCSLCRVIFCVRTLNLMPEQLLERLAGVITLRKGQA